MLKSIFSVSALLLTLAFPLHSQPKNTYNIAFAEAEYHYAHIEATFHDINPGPLEVRMSRVSPGRYALHEFAKNVFGVKAFDSKGKALEVSRPDPYSWLISGHDGTVRIQYKLYANHADGTYSQIDATHAHLNIPATFMYAPALAFRPIEVEFDLKSRSNWKVATQLKPLSTTRFMAPDLQYFMDSPVEVSAFRERSWQVESNGKKQTIRFVLHDNASDKLLDQYVDMVKKIVQAEMNVYGELPEFDFGTYTFLACYAPNVDGDGMEHRNSTVLTSEASLSEGGMEWNIGTVAHEFFHAWNVERIRPASLEPFDFSRANMSGELWFAEGFTSYYTNVILERTGLISQRQLLDRQANTINAVAGSPARKYFNAVEMSMQAPFSDAATSVDPTNRENTFISYYTYGSFLGHMLDLFLQKDKGKSLDGFMKHMWLRHGKAFLPYTLQDLKIALSEYTDKTFANYFFDNYVLGSEIPDLKPLFAHQGIKVSVRGEEKPESGVRFQKSGDFFVISSNPKEGSAAWDARWSMGDKILKIDGKEPSADSRDPLSSYPVGQKLKVLIDRYGEQLETEIILKPSGDIVLIK